MKHNSTQTAPLDEQERPRPAKAEGRALGFKRPRRLLRYEEVRECPACGQSGRIAAELDRGVYRFGPFDVPYPENRRIPILRCGACGLMYKGLAPNRLDLQSLFDTVAAGVWKPHGYDYVCERDFIVRFARNPGSMDLLDIGSGSGEMLEAFHGIPGRRSALDVVKNDRCAQFLSEGEYIIQYVEDPLRWSGEPYDVVLAFDVIEHLYNPVSAFSNLAKLTRSGGLVVLQTGDADRVGPPARLRNWWYLNLLEHHMAWTPKSVALAAARCGFRLEHGEGAQHKDARYMPMWKRAGAGALRAMSRFPRAVPVVLALTSYDPALVSAPGAVDHFTAVLRRT